MNTRALRFFKILIIFGVLLSEGDGVVYYVLPTEELRLCQTETSSCPPGQLCHKMDYLAKHSSVFFSPDHINVTLIFMCGVHNYTKDLTVQNLHSFVMNGAAESEENAIINMLHQMKTPFDNTHSTEVICTTIKFFNVTFVNITTLTMKCPSVTIDIGLLTVRNSNLYGYAGTKYVLSSIIVTNTGSQALLDNCLFKRNCFIVGSKRSQITVKNAIFQSYRHESKSIIVADSSTIILTGYVNFTNSTVGLYSSNFSSGTAIYLINTHPGPKLKSTLLSITAGATVHFTNLTCNNAGGAIHAGKGVTQIDVGAKATVVFKHNSASRRGGALCLWSNSTVIIGVESNIVFDHNAALAVGGGAIFILNGSLIIGSKARVSFSHNNAKSQGGGAIYLQVGSWNISMDARVSFSHNTAYSGGAIFMSKSTLFIDTNAMLFYNNSATVGGALYLDYANMHINHHSVVNFSMNIAQSQGGAVYITEVSDQSIIVDNYAKLFFYNNSATQGGALYVVPTSFTIEVSSESRTQFLNNIATDVGGAVYSELQPALPCMFLITNKSAEISFVGNSANRGIGHHIYGTSTRNYKCDFTYIHATKVQGLPYCFHKFQNDSTYINISFHPDINETLSPVSSAPWRVCLCDSNGKPLCTNVSHIFTNVSVYRGEEFQLLASVVGYDLGTTSGSVYAEFLYPDPPAQLNQSQYEQIMNTNGKCLTVNYTVYTKSNSKLLHVYTSGTSKYFLYGDRKTLNDRKTLYIKQLNSCLSDYNSHYQFGCLCQELLTSPVFINVTLLPGCPPGLSLNNDLTACSCYSVLPDSEFRCFVENKTGYIQWLKENPVWINATFSEGRSDGIIYNHFCPLYYCNLEEKTINIGDDSSKQCASYRTGILCGTCKENYSLAIGSSQCIECPNSHNVGVILAFAAAGVFLVFFILALNLTVTQGFINGVIFYANIIWAYKIVFFPLEYEGHANLMPYFYVFIAWLNLDFGIETCFYVGLDAYWKTWLQFLFPFYIWAIAGVIIIACRYSSCLTNHIGSRAVPLLATLFLLSYMKLLRTVIDATSVAVIAEYPQNTSYAVWYVDGNLRYCQQPHIYLFIAAIATLVFLWLPYTLLLLFIQPLRRVSHLRPIKWINKLAPVYDAYFSPLKNKHQYWFGTMLLVRGVLLIILTATSTIIPELNILILSATMNALFFFVSVKNVYKRMNIRIFESATLLNLIVVSAGILYKWESTESRSTLLIVSIGITFAQFSVIIVLSLIKLCLSVSKSKICRQKSYRSYDIIDERSNDSNITHHNDDITYERIEDPELEDFIAFKKNYNYCAPKATY